MRKKISGIYKLTNRLNGKIYIGKTVDYERRMNEYRNRKSTEKSSRYKIMKIIDKYGFENFDCELIHECDEDDLDYYEMYYINYFKSYMKKYGYNSSHKKSDGKIGLNRTTKALMRKSHIGLKETSDTKRKKSNKIIAIKDDKMYICDSGKLFGDFIGVSKDYVKNCLRQPSKCKGYRLYYHDVFKRLEILSKMYKKKSIRDKEYIKIADYLNESSVEIRESDYHVEYLTYDNHE